MLLGKNSDKSFFLFVAYLFLVTHCCCSRLSIFPVGGVEVKGKGLSPLDAALLRIKGKFVNNIADFIVVISDPQLMMLNLFL